MASRRQHDWLRVDLRSGMRRCRWCPAWMWVVAPVLPNGFMLGRERRLYSSDAAHWTEARPRCAA